MIVPTFTALALIFTLSAQVPTALQVVIQADPVTEDAAPVAVSTPAEAPIIIADTVDGPTPPAIEVADDTATTELVTEVDTSTDNAVPLTPSDPAPQPIPLIAPEIRPVRADLTPAERATILRDTEAALALARTVKGRFEQTNADGTVMTGAFSLRRPGKMRFAYDAPTPILIVSDGVTVAMEDSELETVDRYPLASTPLGLILDEDLSFENDVDVLRVLRSDDKILIAVEDASGEIEGELTMLFSASSLDLLGWTTVNPDLQMTTVELSEVETNIRIDPRQFRLDDDEDEEDER